MLRQAFVSTERLAAVVLSLSIGVRLLRGPYVQARFKLPSAKYDKSCLQTHALISESRVQLISTRQRHHRPAIQSLLDR